MATVPDIFGSLPMEPVPVVLPPAPVITVGSAVTAPKPRVRRHRVNVLGFPIDDMSLRDAANAIVARLNADEPSRVAFINADCVNIAWRDEEYRRSVREADLVFADGVGVGLAAKLLRRPLRANVNGTDLFPVLCAAIEDSQHRVFLLGAKPDVAAEVAKWINRHFPEVQVCGVEDGYFDATDEAAVIARIAKAKPDLLIVAFGEPRQTKWIERHLAATGARVGIGVGGLFDFYSGRIRRAPRWLRRRGMEWAYRLWQEPRRLARRYLIGNVVFLARLAAVWRHRARRAGS